MSYSFPNALRGNTTCFGFFKSDIAVRAYKIWFFLAVSFCSQVQGGSALRPRFFTSCTIFVRVFTSIKNTFLSQLYWSPLGGLTYNFLWEGLLYFEIFLSPGARCLIHKPMGRAAARHFCFSLISPLENSTLVKPRQVIGDYSILPEVGMSPFNHSRAFVLFVLSLFLTNKLCIFARE